MYICYISVLLAGQQLIDRNRTVDRWPYFIGSTSHTTLCHNIEVRSYDVDQILRLNERDMSGRCFNKLME